MTLVKRYDLRGLNLRSSDINRPEQYASDVQNVELNDRKEIVKRFGYDQVTNLVSFDINEYKRGDQLVAHTSDGIKVLQSDNTFKDVNFSGDPIVCTTVPDTDEYSGVLYYTDPDGANHIFKYDGYTQYRAGIPKPTVTTSSVAGNYFYRIILKYRDPRGNITYSDYRQFDNLIDGATFEISQMQDEDGVKGFYEKYGEISSSVLIGVNESDTIPVINHNYVVGDFLLLGNFDQSQDTNTVEVIAVTPTTIQVDTSTLGSTEYQLFAGRAVEERTEIIISVSENETFGYFVNSLTNPAITYGLNKEAGPVSYTAGNYDPNGVPLEDFYDAVIIKGLPPKCKYITFYNNIMMLGNNSDNSDVNFKLTTTDLESSIFWSDTGLGSTVETFPPFNTDTVGRSSEGQITGIISLSDNVVVGKERQVYYGNGNFVLQSYRIRSALTNGVGCISFNSMIEVEGGALFMSSRGLYLGRYGQKPIELSNLIEPIFRRIDGLELDKTKVVNDIKNEKLLIFIPNTADAESIVIVYDYLYKEWFIHRGIDADGGIAFLNDDLYHADEENLFKRSSLYNDNGSAIEAYYKGPWEHAGSPSIEKKWRKAIALSIGDINYDLNIISENDWIEKDVTNEENKITDEVKVIDRSLNMSKSKSMRLTFRNAKKNQGLLLTGYEFIFESTNRLPKGED